MALIQRVCGVAVLASATLLSGCGAFFVCQKASCPASGTTGSNTGDYVYVSNGSGVAGYSLSAGTLTSISGATVDLGFTPVAMAISPNNDFLYIATAPGTTSETAGIYAYAISSTGTLSAINDGNAVASDDTIASMDISPDGNYLTTIGTSTIVGVVMNQYALDTSTGLIPTVQTTFQPAVLAGTSCTLSGSPISQQCTIKFSPEGDFVTVALGQSGFAIYPYTSTGGITSAIPQYSAVPASSSGDYSLAFDKSNYLYVANSFALTSYSGIGGTAAPVQDANVTFVSGITPRSVTVSTGSNYLYTANEGNSTISGYTLPGSGALTSVGAAISGPGGVSALGVDNSGDYLLAAGYNVTNGLQVYNITSTGVLTTTGSVAGTDSDELLPMLMVLTH